MAESPLTTKQQVFVNEYLKSWNATDAARKAGYKGNDATLRVVGSENLAKPNIAAAISQRITENTMSANEALTAMSDMARGDIGDFINVHGGVPVLDFEKAKEAQKLGLIKKITYGRGTIAFELYNKQQAVETIMKKHGLLKDGTQVNVTINIEIMQRFEEAALGAGLEPSALLEEFIQKLHAQRQLTD